ncbi:hypothetical protein U9M48_020235 [Paspalum notatum var. saurae]|uniref:Uncharacterized protein n=1 Tax=Paspalum notatum var. saurae TaxID=547442 RepID=A0AAQ3WS12_PASNO
MGEVPDDEDDVDACRDNVYGDTHDPPIDLGDVTERIEPEANGEPGGPATTSTTKSTGWKRKFTSPVWDDMDEIFKTVNDVQKYDNKFDDVKLQRASNNTPGEACDVL